jgi:spermidine/putrescine transport system substrate-binding protein
VESSIPKEGAYLWGEAISIVSGTKKRDMAKKFVDYCLSAEAQVRFATKPSYTAIIPNGKGWELLQSSKPDWAKRLKMDTTKDPCAITPWRDGRIAIRVLPKDQTVDQWSDLWQEFKNS